MVHIGSAKIGCTMAKIVNFEEKLEKISNKV